MSSLFLTFKAINARDDLLLFNKCHRTSISLIYMGGGREEMLVQ